MFKNLGQKFSSIIHAANLNCDGLSASHPSLASEDGAGRKEEFGAPASRDVRHAQGQCDITLDIPCVPWRASCPSFKTY